MSHSASIANAKIVLANEQIEGSVEIEDGRIAAIDTGTSVPNGAVDFGGDYLLPGLIELHTDNLEKHFAPRPGVNWPGLPAAVAHDAQLSAGGITTVYDAVCLGDLFRSSNRVRHLAMMSESIGKGQAAGIFRAEHRIHLRCELSFEGVVELFDNHADDPLVGLVSLMDHTPGQRQFVNLDSYRNYYQKKYGLSDEDLAAFEKSQREAHVKFSSQHRDKLVERSRARDLPIASHDDATEDHVAEAARLGAVISEFPTTVEAARASRDTGMQVLMGAPNLVLGGSHSGNVSAKTLADEGLLDILSSDYVPTSLIQGVFLLAGDDLDADLPSAARLATLNPARAADLNDRGEIETGKRADLIRVTVCDDMPVVTGVWSEGKRVT